MLTKSGLLLCQTKKLGSQSAWANHLSPEWTNTCSSTDIDLQPSRGFGKLSPEDSGGRTRTLVSGFKGPRLAIRRLPSKSGWLDLNQRPPGSEPGALPDCATSRKDPAENRTQTHGFADRAQRLLSGPTKQVDTTLPNPTAPTPSAAESIALG